jgi:hypothetical protein
MQQNMSSLFRVTRGRDRSHLEGLSQQERSNPSIDRLSAYQPSEYVSGL